MDLFIFTFTSSSRIFDQLLVLSLRSVVSPFPIRPAVPLVFLVRTEKHLRISSWARLTVSVVTNVDAQAVEVRRVFEANR
jgi:hypothetical protein